MAKEKEDKFMSTLNETVKEKIEIEDMPLNTIRDYRLYNEAVIKENKRLKLRRYEVKPCPEELHPTERVVFRSNDQPHNPQKVFLSNSLIHYDKTLIPGQVYKLPQCIVHHLSTRENPEWAWFDNADGSRETRVKSKKPRFSLTPVYQEA